MTDWKSNDYGAPKKYGEGPDWLERAREPSDGWRVAAWVIGIIALVGIAVGLIVSGLIF